MKTASATIGILLALLFTAPNAGAQAASFHYHCYFRVDGDPGKPALVYSSQIVASDKAATTISQAWQKYMLATYPEHTAHASSTCRDFGAAPDHQQYALSSQEKTWTASGLTLIHVTYNPEQYTSASPTAAALPPPSGSTGIYLFCSTEPTEPVVYFSEIFSASPDPSRQRGASFTGVQNAFLVFLKQKYGFKNASNYPVSCRESGNPAQGVSDELALKNAQTNRQKAEEQAKQQTKQIVETGWKYNSGHESEIPTQAPPPRIHH